MLTTAEMFAIVTLLIVGLLGVMGLLVVYIARIVAHLKAISKPLETLARQTGSAPEQA